MSDPRRRPSSRWDQQQPGPSSSSSNFSNNAGAGRKRTREESFSPNRYHNNGQDGQGSIRIKPSGDIMEGDSKEEETFGDVRFLKDDGHEQPMLVNFFNSGSKPLPKIQSHSKGVGEIGAPAPKYPKKAHYNIHDQEEEVKYIEECKKMHNEAIPNYINDSDSEEENFDNTKNLEEVKRYDAKQEVFFKYDFQKRSVNMTSLAAYQQKEKIISAIDKNRVIIIDGFTGCGKTTQVPQFIIDHHVELKKPCNVIVTQPRKLAALSVARRVCEERCWENGTVVGYQVGMEKNVSVDTLVTYMTTGVLLKKLITQKSLRSWTHIIVDEVHERDLETDLLLLVIKKILLDDVEGKEKHVKLILMSATLNARKFSEYFVTRGQDYDDLDETPIIKIPSYRRFKVEELFLDAFLDQTQVEEVLANIDMDKAIILPEIYTHTVRTIVNFDTLERGVNPDPRISKGKAGIKIFDRGSVLVFLPGIMEIKTMMRYLEEENNRYEAETRDDYQWDLVPLHSSITNEEQSKVFSKPQPYRRKIILSTNIAESSITVPDVVYVIDLCLTKSNCVDSRTNFSCLKTVWASVNQCIQRKGRAGRVRDGKVYRMVPKAFFAAMEQEATPDMLRASLEYVVLQVKILDMGSPKELLSLALDPPQVSGIERAVSNLKEVGALTVMTNTHRQDYDTCDGDVTLMGQIMASLPISPQCSRLIMLGHCFGVRKEAIIIAAGLSGKTPFSTPFNHQLDSYLKRLKWSNKSYSDCFAILYAYREYQRRHSVFEKLNINVFNEEKKWGKQNYVQIVQIREIKNLVEDIEERLQQKGVGENRLKDYTNDDDEIPKEVMIMLKVAIAGAFYPNYFHRSRPDIQNYERERSKDVSGYDLFSTVYYRKFPNGHNGKLYEKHVADALSYGMSQPIVKVEGSKVFAIFDNLGDKIGPICEGMYRAIKKRQLRDNLEFTMLWQQDEEAEYTRQMKEQTKRRHMRCPQQVDLPSITVATIKVAVTHIETPSQFYVISSGHRYLLDEMTEFINRNLLNVPLPRNQLAIGALCLAAYRWDGRVTYYRAKIVRFNAMEEILVYFVDYGNSVWVNKNEVQAISPVVTAKCWPVGSNGRNLSTHEVPCLAVECRLSETKPAILHSSVWTESAIVKMRQFTADMRELICKIHAVDKSIIIGELIDPHPDREGRQLNFNEYLKQEGMADYAPEPYTATLNYQARSRLDLIGGDRDQIRACNDSQIAPPIDRLFLEPPTYGRTPCTLQGPFSPLELDFQSLCHSSISKQVTVDNHSVNSVLLDHEPTAPTSRLLVASSINIQDKSGKVVARETTLMPAIPGLLALMALVFSPTAELRCDPRMTRYTGVLCGLGCDPEGNPIYMDHDMEVAFDTCIDDEDIETINFIRHNMNVILRECHGANISSVHTDLWRRMFGLLKKKRERVDEEIWPQESFIWGRIPERSRKLAPGDKFPFQPSDIFAPHSTIHLVEENPDEMSWDWGV